MAIELPPEIYFNGIIYNPDYYPNAEDATGLSQSTADARYLIVWETAFMLYAVYKPS